MRRNVATSPPPHTSTHPQTRDKCRKEKLEGSDLLYSTNESLAPYLEAPAQRRPLETVCPNGPYCGYALQSWGEAEMSGLLCMHHMHVHAAHRWRNRASVSEKDKKFTYKVKEVK
ncbi:Protocadherin Beta-6 [Manis pentadactyla]|nr:Protocadherin Beta-6 [Manis pentadactyla]